MPRYTYTAAITSPNGRTRTDAGTVDLPHAFSKGRAEVDIANRLSSGQRGERITVTVRHAS